MLKRKLLLGNSKSPIFLQGVKYTLFLLLLICFHTNLTAQVTNQQGINSDIPGLGKSNVWKSNSIITKFTLTDANGNAYFNSAGEQQIFPQEGDDVKVRVEWQLFKGTGENEIDLTDSLQASQTYYFEYQLPDFFSITTASTIDAKTNGTKFGEYKLGTDGKFKIEISGDAIINNSFYHLSGVYGFTGKVHFTDPTNPPTISIPNISNNSSTITINPPATPSSDNSTISKTGVLVDDEHITWTITAIPNISNGSCENLKITDTKPSASATYLLGEPIVTWNGLTLVKGSDYTVSNGEISFIVGSQIPSWADLNGKQISVTYPATVGKDIWGSFINKAKLTSTGGIDKTSLEAVVEKVPVQVSKRYVQYDPNTKTIFWEISYNSGHKVIPEANAWIGDKLDSHHSSFTNVTVYRVEDTGNTLLNKPLDYELELISSDSLRVLIGDDDGHGNVTKEYIIRYTTTLTGTDFKNEVLNASAGNQVTVFEGPGIGPGGVTYTSPGALAKTVSSIDYSNQTATWAISINKVGYDLADNWEVSDSIGNGLNIINAGSATAEVEVKDATNSTVLTAGTDYTIAWARGDSSFIITPTNTPGTYFATLANRKHQYTITVKTKWDYKGLTPSDNNSFKNTAKLKVYNGGQSYELTASGGFTPISIIKTHGTKSGSYDATTRRITWKLALNPNNRSYAHPVFADTLKNQQKYVDGSLKAYKLRLNTTGGIATPVASDNIGNYAFEKLTDAFSNEVLKLTFTNPLDSGIYITYQTSLKDTLILSEYSNIGILDEETGPTPKRDSVFAKVTIPKGSTFIQKDGRYKDGNFDGVGENDPEFAYWRVIINPNGSTVYNVIVEDTLSATGVSTLRLDKDSIFLYKLSLNSNGDLNYSSKILIPNDNTVYTLTTNGNTLQLKFKVTITDPYALYYRSYVELEDQTTTAQITNKATIKDSGTINNNNPKTVSVTPSDYYGVGNVEIRKPIIIKKMSVASTTLKLPGAVFDIYKEKSGYTHNVADEVPAITGITYLKTDTTSRLVGDSLGTIIVKLKPGYYWLCEVEAPSGYILPSEEKRWTRINVANSVVEFTVENTPKSSPTIYLSVTLPPVEFPCISLDPVPGSYYIEEGGCFTFRFLYEECCELPYEFKPVVTANGEIVQPNAEGVYSICGINKPVNITITPNEAPAIPVGIEKLGNTTYLAWTADQKIYVHSLGNTNVSIYSVTGQLLHREALTGGDTKAYSYAKGVYIVKFNDGVVRKVIVK